MNKTQMIGKIFFMERHLQNMMLPSMLEQGTMIDNSGWSTFYMCKSYAEDPNHEIIGVIDADGCVFTHMITHD